MALQQLNRATNPNYDNVDRIIATATRLFSKARALGLLTTNAARQTVEATRLIGEVTNWLNNVEPRIRTYTPAAALTLTDAYDLMHRIAYCRPADTSTINPIILKAFEARIHGDRTVDEYILYRAIRTAITRHDKAYLGRPLEWMSRSIDTWYNEAKHGYEHTTLPPYDIISRATILLQTDLRAYEGPRQAAFKRHLYEQTRPHLANYNATASKYSII